LQHKPAFVFVVAREDAAMREFAPAAETCIRLLGGFSVTVAGHPVANRWRLRKAKTLVKLLALAPGHRLHREIVVDSLWRDADPQATANNLHQLVHTIRNMMGAESITLTDDVLRLCPGGGMTVDVDVFEQTAAHARRTGDLTALKAALDRWTGPLLPEDSYADWAEEHRDRLTETHAAVATLLGSKLVELGERDAALALLEPLASSRPLDEQLHRVLIDVVAGLGRRWEAIEIYERLRDALDDAYGAQPEPQTKALYRRLLSSGKPILDAQSLDTQQRPRPQTLVGRQREWERLCFAAFTATVGPVLGSDVSLTIKSGTDSERTYSSLSAIEKDALPARIWLGIHFRDAMDDGYRLGHLTGKQVSGQLD
jgi:DNA-binding SARP family transcriptional activator